MHGNKRFWSCYSLQKETFYAEFFLTCRDVPFCSYVWWLLKIQWIYMSIFINLVNWIFIIEEHTLMYLVFSILKVLFSWKIGMRVAEIVTHSMHMCQWKNHKQPRLSWKWPIDQLAIKLNCSSKPLTNNKSISRIKSCPNRLWTDMKITFFSTAFHCNT